VVVLTWVACADSALRFFLEDFFSCRLQKSRGYLLRKITPQVNMQSYDATPPVAEQLLVLQHDPAA